MEEADAGAWGGKSAPSAVQGHPGAGAVQPTALPAVPAVPAVPKHIGGRTGLVQLPPACEWSPCLDGMWMGCGRDVGACFLPAICKDAHYDGSTAKMLLVGIDGCLGCYPQIDRGGVSCCSCVCLRRTEPGIEDRLNVTVINVCGLLDGCYALLCWAVLVLEYRSNGGNGTKLRRRTTYSRGRRGT